MHVLASFPKTHRRCQQVLATGSLRMRFFSACQPFSRLVRTQSICSSGFSLQIQRPIGFSCQMRYAIGPAGYCQSVLLSCGTGSLNSPESQRVIETPPQRCLRKGGNFPFRDSYRGDWHRPAILSSVRRVAWSCVARPLEKSQIATVSPAPWQPPTLSSESCMSNNCSRSSVIAHTTLMRFVTPPYPQSV